MSDINVIYKKIVLDNSRFGSLVFADYYRYGSDNNSSIPLVIYIGGSISDCEYEQRRETRPESIDVEFLKAYREISNCQCIDLLISPPPPQGHVAHNILLREFFIFLMNEVLINTQNPRPNSMAIIGYSFGAYLATYIAFNLPMVYSLSTIGGGGMDYAASQCRNSFLNNKKIFIFSNTNDGTEDEDRKFLEYLSSQKIESEIFKRESGHTFSDYVNNNSVKDAFKFAIESVCRY